MLQDSNGTLNLGIAICVVNDSVEERVGCRFDHLVLILQCKFLELLAPSHFKRALDLPLGLLGKTWDEACLDATLQDVELAQVHFLLGLFICEKHQTVGLVA